MAKTETPPPGAVHELAERAVDFVRRALGIALDYTPETLPVLDHYLGQVPRDQTATVELVATTAGSYFGETVRRSLGGEWKLAGDRPADWLVILTGDVRFSPVSFCVEAIMESEVEGFDGTFEVPKAEQDFVAEALEGRGEVTEEEFYSLSGRLETLTYVVDILAARRAAGSNGTHR